MSRFYALFVLLTFSIAAHGQQPFAIKPYAITLPQVTTTQQTNPATVPQSQANLVYNTSVDKLALNTGGQWQYLVTNSDLNAEFPNFAAYQYSFGSVYQCWTIPAGVTKFAIELWGAGTGGNKYSTSGSYGDCRGGQAGGYARRIYAVASGATTVTLTVGKGGSGTVTTGAFPTGTQLGAKPGFYIPVLPPVCMPQALTVPQVPVTVASVACHSMGIGLSEHRAEQQQGLHRLATLKRMRLTMSLPLD